jgi:hypothetical protein
MIAIVAFVAIQPHLVVNEARAGEFVAQVRTEALPQNPAARSEAAECALEGQCVLNTNTSQIWNIATQTFPTMNVNSSCEASGYLLEEISALLASLEEAMRQVGINPPQELARGQDGRVVMGLIQTDDGIILMRRGRTNLLGIVQDVAEIIGAALVTQAAIDGHSAATLQIAGITPSEAAHAPKGTRLRYVASKAKWPLIAALTSNPPTESREAFWGAFLKNAHGFRNEKVPNSIRSISEQAGKYEVSFVSERAA